MSPVDVQELRRRLADSRTGEFYVDGPCDDDGFDLVCTVADGSHWHIGTFSTAREAGVTERLRNAAPAILDELESLRAEVSELRNWQIQARVREDLARVAADESRETVKALRAQVSDAQKALSLAGFGGTLVEQVGAVLERVRRLEHSNAMACESPNPKCECAGCDMARHDGEEGYGE